MASFQTVQVSEAEVHVAISGEVDAHAAEALRALLPHLRSRVVVLDFTHAGLLHDLLFAVLTEPRDGGRRLRLLGLSEHQRRLLHYLHYELDGRGQLLARPTSPLV